MVSNSIAKTEKEKAFATNRCRLCGSTNFRHLQSAPDWLMPEEGVFHAYICEECGLGETRPKLSPEELAQHYPVEQYSPYHNRSPKSWSPLVIRLKQWNARWKYRALVQANLGNRFVSSVLSVWPLLRWSDTRLPFKINPGSVLDIGCSDGAFLRQAHAQGWQCYGVELTAGLADALVDEGIAEIRYGRFEDLHFSENERFDLITMWHVLEHFENPVPVLRQCATLLRKDGLLAIGIPILSPLEIRVWQSWYHALELPRHQSHFTLQALYRLFDETGFEVRQVVYDANSNNWIHSFNNFQISRNTKFRLSTKSRWLRWALKPLSIMLKVSCMSGRITVYSTRKA